MPTATDVATAVGAAVSAAVPPPINAAALAAALRGSGGSGSSSGTGSGGITISGSSSIPLLACTFSTHSMPPEVVAWHSDWKAKGVRQHQWVIDGHPRSAPALKCHCWSGTSHNLVLADGTLFYHQDAKEKEFLCGAPTCPSDIPADVQDGCCSASVIIPEAHVPQEQRFLECSEIPGVEEMDSQQ